MRRHLPGQVPDPDNEALLHQQACEEPNSDGAGRCLRPVSRLAEGKCRQPTSSAAATSTIASKAGSSAGWACVQHHRGQPLTTSTTCKSWAEQKSPASNCMRPSMSSFAQSYPPLHHGRLVRLGSSGHRISQNLLHDNQRPPLQSFCETCRSRIFFVEVSRPDFD